MLKVLKNKLNVQENRAIHPIFSIKEVSLDKNLSTIEETDGFLCCNLVSKDGTKCPFEFHLAKGENRLHLNFYVGLGAEFYNYEDIGNQREQDATALDIDRFLRSTIRCQRFLSKKGVVLAKYWPSELRFSDGMQICLTYRSGFVWPCIRYSTETINYSPWVVENRIV